MYRSCFRLHLATILLFLAACSGSSVTSSHDGSKGSNDGSTGNGLLDGSEPDSEFLTFDDDGGDGGDGSSSTAGDGSGTDGNGTTSLGPSCNGVLGCPTGQVCLA